MAKIKTPRIPTPKTKMHWLDKLFAGIGGLSPVIGRQYLNQSAKAVNAANLAKYGKWGARGMGLFNPWTAVPVGLMGLAQYGVGKAFDPYRDETGKIGAEGHERLLQERLAREDLAARRNLAREEGVGFWERAQMKRDGGLAGLL